MLYRSDTSRNFDLRQLRLFVLAHQTSQMKLLLSIEADHADIRCRYTSSEHLLTSLQLKQNEMFLC